MADLEQRKSSYKTMLEALGRTQRRYEGAKDKIETVATEGMRTVIVAGTSMAAGAADQYFGVEDKETGIRSHKTNGAPTALLAAGVTKAAALFGLFGKAEQVGFAVGDGATGHAFSTFGRELGERFRREHAKADEAKGLPQGQAVPQVEGARVPASAVVATTAPAAQKAAV